MNDELEQLLSTQVSEAQARHPNLTLLRDPSGALKILGRVGFSVELNSHTIDDSFRLRFVVPPNYPASPPFVFETGGQIPAEFGHFMAAGNLCLGAPVEVRRRFSEHRSLLRFIEDQVVPYLVSYSYKRDFGQLPFGELSHGIHGLIQYYKRFFSADLTTSLQLLKCLADACAPPLMACPCGGGRRLRDCHGPKLAELRPHLCPEDFEWELREMIEAARAEGVQLPERKVMPKRVLKSRERKLRTKEHGKDRKSR